MESMGEFLTQPHPHRFQVMGGQPSKLLLHRVPICLASTSQFLLHPVQCWEQKSRPQGPSIMPEASIFAKSA